LARTESVGPRLFLPGMSDVQAPILIVGVAATRQWDWTSAPDDE
jgi:hypothetical protein